MGGALSSRESTRLQSSNEKTSDLDFLWEIFQWKPNWLKSTIYDRKPPPIFEKGKQIESTSLSYNNFGEYSKSLKPLMLLEFFHILKKENEEISDKAKNKSRMITGDIFHFRIDLVSNHKNKKALDFDLKTEIPISLEGTYPLQGELVKIEYGGEREAFGYIEGLKRKRLKVSSLTGEKCCLMKKCLRGGCILELKYNIHTKLISIEPNFQKNVKVTSVMMMSQYFRLLRALERFSECRLRNSVLHPEIENFKMSDGKIPKVYPLTSGQILNPIQMKIVAGIVQTIEEKKERICLIQGPPGTGKSTVIVNIILEILKNSKEKILICAPSNKAVDEIVLRLLAVDNIVREQGLDLKIVRVGRDEAMDPGVKDVCLTNLCLYSQMRGLNIQKYRNNQRKSEEEILKNANVIASTLASCFSYKMERFFGSRHGMRLPICIVDEAGQATEVGTLLPLMLGVKTLILVGDPKQLPPTIFSQVAKEKGMNVSLFARAEKNFKNQKKNPIMMLKIQYRMVETIARWPNRYFYKGKLATAAIVPTLPLHNYRILNHNFQQTKSMHGNKIEAEMVRNIIVGIIDELLKINEKVPSIGVITPYREQKQLVFDSINDLCQSLTNEEVPKKTSSKRKNRRKRKCRKEKKATEVKENVEEKKNPLRDILKNITINTVDSFQGQERDIIIMSCVRSNGIGFVSNPNRLNVSLTRAKHTMILCGNFKTFRKNHMWRNLLSDAESRGHFFNVVGGNMQIEKLKNLVFTKNCEEELKVSK